MDERAEYGDIAKEAIRRIATREAALVDVTRAGFVEPRLREIAARIEGSFREHRPYIDRVEKMSRGVQGINLRVGQDFDGDMRELMQIVGTEIEWELDEALPAIRGSLTRGELDDALKSAEHSSKHVPTNLDPERPR